MRRKMYKFLSILLCVYIISLFISPVQNCAFNSDKDIIENTNISEAYEEYLKLPEDEKQNSGIIPRKYDVPFKSNKNSKLRGTGELPTSYVLVGNDMGVDVDEYGNINMGIEDQGSYELCWAFSSINALETNLAKKGIYNPDGELYDFSELHLDYLGYEGIRDQYGNIILEDRYYLHGPGTFYHFLQYVIVNQYGVVLEEEVPYNAQYSTQSDFNYLYSLFKRADVLDFISFPTIDKVNQKVLMEVNGEYDYYDLNDSILTEFRESVKRHIINNGSIYAGVDSSCMKWSNGQPLVVNYSLNLQNDGSKVVLNSKTGRADHAISIIGWDDNFSRDNFPEGSKPEHDGAYIAMNTWGEDLGNNNIFYISYEDYYVEHEMSGIVNSEIIDPLAIVIKKGPNKKEYFAGENFDSTGMKVVAKYQDGTEVEITDYQYSNGTLLTAGQNSIRIEYLENNRRYYNSVNGLTVYKAKNQYIPGDINEDGKFTLYDAFEILKRVVNNNSFNKKEIYIIDINNDGKVTLFDAYKQIHRYFKI